MENNEESNKVLVTLLVVFILMVLGFGGWIVYDKFLSDKSPSEPQPTNPETSKSLKEYYEESEIEVKRITTDEAASLATNHKLTCGLTDVSDGVEGAECLEEADDYIAYIDNGTPYYMSPAIDCEMDEVSDCEEVDGYYELLKFSFIKNAKSIISKFDQYIGMQFAVELENGDVYYFTSLYDAKIVDDKSYISHLVKLDLPAKLKKFSNVANGQITYGTEIVLELENNEKYVLVYNYETNKASTVKYSDYIAENHEFDDSIELSESEEKVKVSTTVLKSEKLNTIIKSNKFVSDNLDEQDYDGICPQIAIDIDEKTLHFHVLQIANTKVFLYTDNDNSDGRLIEVYGLDEDSLYYARFFAVDYEDPKNHSLVLRKYDIANVESVALITINDKTNMLTDTEVPETPINYAIFKTSDGKYYTDYNLDSNEEFILREVIQK